MTFDIELERDNLSMLVSVEARVSCSCDGPEIDIQWTVVNSAVDSEGDEMLSLKGSRIELSKDEFRIVYAQLFDTVCEMEGR